jgi:methionyl-tRNA formyltransferase
MEKLSLTGAKLLIDTLPGWFAKEIQPQPQNNAWASYTRMMKKEAGEIDWKSPAVQIWRQVRAYQPWPGSLTKWQSKQIKILEAIPLALHDVAEPGTVVALKDSPAPFGVTAGDGVLGIIKLQMEGKKAVTAKEFLNGQRQIIGSVLGRE